MTSGLDWYYQARERASRPTYQAQQGANWWTMAQQIYGNPGMAGVLSKANPNTYTIRAGQQVNAPKVQSSGAPLATRRFGQKFVTGGARGAGNASGQSGLGVAGGGAGYNMPPAQPRYASAPGVPQYAQGLGVAGAGGMNMPGARLPGSQPVVNTAMPVTMGTGAVWKIMQGQRPAYMQPWEVSYLGLTDADMQAMGYATVTNPGGGAQAMYMDQAVASPAPQAARGGGGGYTPPRGGGGGGRGRSTGYGPGRMFDTAGQYNTALLGSTSWRI